MRTYIMAPDYNLHLNNIFMLNRSDLFKSSSPIYFPKKHKKVKR